MKLFAFGVLALLIAVAAAACTPPPAARTATFRQRPDAVAPGNLTGPFTGRVLDAANRAPVTGAVVYATWTFERSTPLPVAAGYKEAVASTDATGRYRLPELTSVPSGARAEVAEAAVAPVRDEAALVDDEREVGDARAATSASSRTR